MKLKWSERYNVHRLCLPTVVLLVYWENSAFLYKIQSGYGETVCNNRFDDVNEAKKAAITEAMNLTKATLDKLELLNVA